MFIKHERMMDICLEVRHYVARPDGGFKAYGSWWNLGQSGASFSIGIETKISVDASDVTQWKKCVDAQEDLRGAAWVEL